MNRFFGNNPQKPQSVPQPANVAQMPPAASLPPAKQYDLSDQSKRVIYYFV